MPKDKIHPVDRHVGQRVRLARKSKNMSQTALAQATGITFQQVQKYEKGTNRVSASRLFDFAGVLGVDVCFFFEGAGESHDPADAKVTARDLSYDWVDVEILRHLRKIDDGELKRKLLRLIESMRSLAGSNQPQA